MDNLCYNQECVYRIVNIQHTSTLVNAGLEQQWTIYSLNSLPDGYGVLCPANRLFIVICATLYCL